MPSTPSHLLVAVVGPTGSGKSELAIRLATQLDGEIVNCDSLQIYRYFNIGTAKTPPAERAGIPHHLIDIAEPGDTFTAGDFARLAAAIVEKISTRAHHFPILAGGTGFYLSALLDGLSPGPQRDESLRNRLRKHAVRHPGGLHRLLARLDPSTAARIHPNDTQKLIRALEICLQARRPASVLFQQPKQPAGRYHCLKLGLDPDRQQLYDRLNQRAARMFETGLTSEVESLLAAGHSPQAKPFQSLGYKQAVQLLRGVLTLEEAVESTQKETRHYAKRQWTWFRRDPEVIWFQGFGSDSAIQADALVNVRAFIEKFSNIKEQS